MKPILRTLAVCIIAVLIITFPVKKEPPKQVVEVKKSIKSKLVSLFQKEADAQVVTDVKKEEVKINFNSPEFEGIKPEAPTAPVAAPDPKPEPVPAPAPIAPPAPSITGSHADWMRLAGIPANDWPAVDFIVSHESTWNVFARNPSSAAYGLCQSLPANKMASAGADWETNPVTQLRWCHQYAMDRYNGWWNSMAFWKAHLWW